MAKRARPTHTPDAANPPLAAPGGTKRLKRLERELGDLRASETKYLRQLENVRARSAAVAAQIAALQPMGTVAADEAPLLTAGPIGYCLREKRAVTIRGPVPTTFANGRSGVSGTCPSCGARVTALVRAGAATPA
jgi:hypothetical protein